MSKSSVFFDKLEALDGRFREIELRLGDAGTWNDPKLAQKLSQERAELQPIVTTYNEHRQASQELKENELLLKEESDPELRDMCKEEIGVLREKLPKLEDAIQLLLLPKDPNDRRNAILEIRAGTGGAEAALFAAEIFRMYSRHAESNGWQVEVLSLSEAELGGCKEVVAQISGTEVYSRLKFESGVHRVQRVPVTETQGRVHTSAITVAIMPEAEEVDVDIETKDLRIDTYRASGAGGQHVNKTDSAIRITHEPSGLVVTCQDEKSQHKNKAKAMKVLRTRLYEQKLEKQKAKESEMRRSQIGSGDRSEKIRTYNFPQNRVSDHRIGLTLYKLDQIIEGSLNQLFDPLTAAMQAEALKTQTEM